MPIKLIRNFGVAMIRFFGDLDMEEFVQMKNLVSTLVDEGSVQIVLDLERVEHINATGIGILADRLHFVRHNHGDLKLANVHPKLEMILELTGVKNQFHIYKSVQQAVQNFHAYIAAA